jgi:hypothetical protein
MVEHQQDPLTCRSADQYQLLFLFEGVAERWLSDDDWANFRGWARHPGADQVIADN